MRLLWFPVSGLPFFLDPADWEFGLQHGWLDSTVQHRRGVTLARAVLSLTCTGFLSGPLVVLNVILSFGAGQVVLRGSLPKPSVAFLTTLP